MTANHPFFIPLPFLLVCSLPFSSLTFLFPYLILPFLLIPPSQFPPYPTDPHPSSPFHTTPYLSHVFSRFLTARPISCFHSSNYPVLFFPLKGLGGCRHAAVGFAVARRCLRFRVVLIFNLWHVTKTNMAEGIQKRLQNEIEKYKSVQKGKDSKIVYVHHYNFWHITVLSRR